MTSHCRRHSPSQSLFLERHQIVRSIQILVDKFCDKTGKPLVLLFRTTQHPSSLFRHLVISSDSNFLHFPKTLFQTTVSLLSHKNFPISSKSNHLQLNAQRITFNFLSLHLSFSTYLLLDFLIIRSLFFSHLSERKLIPFCNINSHSLTFQLNFSSNLLYAHHLSLEAHQA